MTDDDKRRFGGILTGLAEYYQRPISPVILDLYWQGLRRFDLTAIQDAVGRHIAAGDTGQFMPKVSDIAKLIEGSSGDAALMAWAKVLKAAKSVGAYATVAFDDPITHAVLSDMGGWVQICHTAEDELPFREKDFCGRYRAYKQRPSEQVSYPPKLLGVFDQENASKGYDEQPVTLIGDPAKAQLVLKNGGKSDWLRVTLADKGIKLLDAA